MTYPKTQMIIQQMVNEWNERCRRKQVMTRLQKVQSDNANLCV